MKKPIPASAEKPAPKAKATQPASAFATESIPKKTSATRKSPKKAAVAASKPRASAAKKAIPKLDSDLSGNIWPVWVENLLRSLGIKAK